jgi:hypothetical protein
MRETPRLVNQIKASPYRPYAKMWQDRSEF